MNKKELPEIGRVIRINSREWGVGTEEFVTLWEDGKRDFRVEDCDDLWVYFKSVVHGGIPKICNHWFKRGDIDWEYVEEGHKHAQSMLEYAEDARISNSPWEEWEYNKHGCWVSLENHPKWCSKIEYRRKPKTITINGIDVPVPITKAPNLQSRYHIPFITSSNITESMTWYGDEMDERYLTRGLVHLSEENARAHAEALLAACKQ